MKRNTVEKMQSELLRTRAKWQELQSDCSDNMRLWRICQNKIDVLDTEIDLYRRILEGGDVS